MAIGIKPTGLTPTQTRTLTSLSKLIASEDINNYSVDVKITDNLEMIPWWNIIARIWNRSHLDSSEVAKTLLTAVENKAIINSLTPEQARLLSNKLLFLMSKIVNGNHPERNKLARGTLDAARNGPSDFFVKKA